MGELAEKVSAAVTDAVANAMGSVKKPATTPRMVIEARVREILPPEIKVSETTWNTLNESIYTLVDQAVQRCLANGRKTLKPQDF